MKNHYARQQEKEDIRGSALTESHTLHLIELKIPKTMCMKNKVCDIVRK